MQLLKMMLSVGVIELHHSRRVIARLVMREPKELRLKLRKLKHLGIIMKVLIIKVRIRIL